MNASPGLSTVHVNRTMQELRAKGLIISSKHARGTEENGTRSPLANASPDGFVRAAFRIARSTMSDAITERLER